MFPPLPVKRVVRPTPTIPDHEVVRQIGSGAYGEVWLAKSMTGAWRAVKIVWREDFDDERTFIREFEGILQYEPVARNHPGLVHILHVGRNDGDHPFYYYVMELGDDARTGVKIDPAEYIPRTLRTDKRFSGNKPLPIDYCLEVGSQLAHALLYLHSKKLTHRDIKPANVIFVNGRPKLADIGLVAHQDQRSFVGTEGFIPPDGPGTQRADVYALAKVLYEISTGKDRMDFPELPDELPKGAVGKKWQAFNGIICQAAEPRIEECLIDSAEELAEKIDALRGYEVPTRFRAPKKKKLKKIKNAAKLLLAVAMGAGIAYGSVLWLNKRQQSANTPAHPAPDTTPGQTDTQTAKPHTGYVLITSTPVGASVYDAAGNYLDETPYGPQEVPAGTTLTYTIKKAGYADREDTGLIKAGETLSLGGALKELRPPVEGKEWTDSEGRLYLPDKAGGHSSADVLRARDYERFLRADDRRNLPHMQAQRRHDALAAANPPVLLTHKAVIAYVSWLNKKCAREGLISKDYTITALALPKTEDSTHGKHEYLLSVNRVYQVPVTIATTPPGAKVYFNDKFIGVTPLEEFVNQVPYVIEVKLPGHRTVTESGMNPLNLNLSLQPEPNESAGFNKPRTNSLGMELVPVNRKLVMSHEVRLKDYRQFLKETSKKAPLPPDFPQEDNHPVVNVTKEDATEFAQWLTAKERAAGLIADTDCYRLPTDEEWSSWVNLPIEHGSTPYERSLPQPDVYDSFSWGAGVSMWPPPEKTGNFADKSALSHLPPARVIVGYNDDYPYTAPVQSYPPDSKGLYDLDGNVMEWVADSYGGPQSLNIRHYNVARGAAFRSFRPKQLTTGMRTPMPPRSSDSAVGFRLILCPTGQ